MTSPIILQGSADSIINVVLKLVACFVELLPFYDKPRLLLYGFRCDLCPNFPKQNMYKTHETLAATSNI